MSTPESEILENFSEEHNSPHYESIKNATGSLFAYGLMTGGILGAIIAIVFALIMGSHLNPMITAVIIVLTIIISISVGIVGMRRGEGLMRYLMAIDESKDQQIRELVSGKDIIIEGEDES